MAMEKPRSRRSHEVRKYTVSLPKDIAEEIRERVGPTGFSAYVTRALEELLERERLAELAAAFDAKYGSAPDEEISEAEEVFRKAREKWARRRATNEKS
ncbi:hypothetical protein DEF23_12050 [Marinitenerispora sediminis]|uniref:CopG family transcriptional regulator n=2 Tax=Marinitenerispora sediminis TaxID=1931232 RepID=A0A368T3M9_9ACTN|nr:hypothetical protein DEF28_05245 [Marinitenerispora sediminis]RCV56717.1 hypothetical protein DEF23_12050 [Marinitenerispora sediminis]RCV56746.1 hypothetical protein DEF24_16145 [Marinitenerispora sediminis]